MVKTPWNKGLTKHTDERIRKQAENMQGEGNPFYGKTHTKEKRENWSKYRRGLEHTIETKKKISQRHKGKPKSEEHKAKLRELYLGKTYEELHGPKKAIEIRKKISMNSKDQWRDKNSNWLGGISFEPYTLDFNSKFRELIKERDNRCCLLCNKIEEDLKYSLSVHHIDYEKLNTFPQNCVSLCRDCHSYTNHNRQQWKPFFQSLLKKMYGYEYTQDQKIILDFVKEGDIKW